jgi:hypothetical protein
LNVGFWILDGRGGRIDDFGFWILDFGFLNGEGERG